jgi:hypothetical protein
MGFIFGARVGIYGVLEVMLFCRCGRGEVGRGCCALAYAECFTAESVRACAHATSNKLATTNLKMVWAFASTALAVVLGDFSLF